MKEIKLERKKLNSFGITMGAAFLIITAVILIRHKDSILPASIISGVFFISAFLFPAILKPLYIIWMWLAQVLSWINTRIILCLIFYLVFTPLGLLLKLFGKDLLDRRIEKNKESYWKKKELKDFNPLDYERQF